MSDFLTDLGDWLFDEHPLVGLIVTIAVLALLIVLGLMPTAGGHL